MYYVCSWHFFESLITIEREKMDERKFLEAELKNDEINSVDSTQLERDKYWSFLGVLLKRLISGQPKNTNLFLKFLQIFSIVFRSVHETKISFDILQISLTSRKNQSWINFPVRMYSKFQFDFCFSKIFFSSSFCFFWRNLNKFWTFIVNLFKFYF